MQYERKKIEHVRLNTEHLRMSFSLLAPNVEYFVLSVYKFLRLKVLKDLDIYLFIANSLIFRATELRKLSYVTLS